MVRKVKNKIDDKLTLFLIAFNDGSAFNDNGFKPNSSSGFEDSFDNKASAFGDDDSFGNRWDDPFGATAAANAANDPFAASNNNDSSARDVRKLSLKFFNFKI